MSQFLKNLAPDWTQHQKWVDAALLKIGKSPKLAQAVSVGSKTIEVKTNVENYLTVLVKPNLKPLAKEL